MLRAGCDGLCAAGGYSQGTGGGELEEGGGESLC